MREEHVWTGWEELLVGRPWAGMEGDGAEFSGDEVRQVIRVMDG